MRYSETVSLEFIDAIECPKCEDECDELLASLVREADFDVIPIDQFPDFISAQLMNIRRWYKGEVLPEDVVTLMRIRRNRKKTASIQATTGYSYIQVMMWVGEVKLQLMERWRRTSRELGRLADTNRTEPGAA